jgi:uncharacterized membrane protein required for colicin V production
MSLMDLVIVILFIAGVVIGFRRGFILQAIHLIGFLVAYIVAYRYFDQVSPMLKTWLPYPLTEETGSSPWLQVIDVEGMYYAAIAFALLFFGTKIALQVVGRCLHLITLLPGLNIANRSLGGILGFLEVTIIIFVIAHVLLFIPWSTGQIWLSESVIGSWMTEQSPYVSNQLQEIWKTRSE